MSIDFPHEYSTFNFDTGSKYRHCRLDDIQKKTRGNHQPSWNCDNGYFCSRSFSWLSFCLDNRGRWIFFIPKYRKCVSQLWDWWNLFMGKKFFSSYFLIQKIYVDFVCLSCKTKLSTQKAGKTLFKLNKLCHSTDSMILSRFSRIIRNFRSKFILTWLSDKIQFNIGRWKIDSKVGISSRPAPEGRSFVNVNFFLWQSREIFAAPNACLH